MWDGRDGGTPNFLSPNAGFQRTIRGRRHERRGASFLDSQSITLAGRLPRDLFVYRNSFGDLLIGETHEVIRQPLTLDEQWSVVEEQTPLLPWMLIKSTTSEIGDFLEAF